MKHKTLITAFLTLAVMILISGCGADPQNRDGQGFRDTQSDGEYSLPDGKVEPDYDGESSDDGEALWSEWVLLSAPTCSEDGLMMRYHLKTGEREYVTVSATGIHDYSASGRGYCKTCNTYLVKTEADIYDALKKENVKIVLLKDIKLKTELEICAPCTIDGAGHAIYGKKVSVLSPDAEIKNLSFEKPEKGSAKNGQNPQ